MQQMNFALYSQQPDVWLPKYPETVAASQCWSSSTKAVHFSISVWVFISHTSVMRPADFALAASVSWVLKLNPLDWRKP